VKLNWPEHVIRKLLLVIAVVMFMNYWAKWRTSNLSAAQGGSYTNPFNDVKRFCCVYDKAPCALDVVCTTKQTGVRVTADHLKTERSPLQIWFWYLALTIVCGLWPLVQQPNSELPTIVGVVIFGVALSLGWTHAVSASPPETFK
jgi:hypothetical protein